jgi:hypothetical protein
MVKQSYGGKERLIGKTVLQLGWRRGNDKFCIGDTTMKSENGKYLKVKCSNFEKRLTVS